MPSNHTENYQLSQWEATDQVKREDFNADNAKIDAALSQKAEVSALTALTQVVNTKGNCHIVTGQYIGDGRFGSDNTLTLSFDNKLIMLFVFGQRTMFAVRGAADGLSMGAGGNVINKIFWGDKSVSWYSNENAYYHMNESGKTYPYIAFLEL